MKVLVTGANGFIASAIVEALLVAGIEVLACARSPANLPDSPLLSFRPVDLHDFSSPERWQGYLDDVQVVINCAGILRECHPGDFEIIHYQAPQALAVACGAAGVGKFIQISALGSAADGAFISSKHRFDDWLLAAGPAATVIRPSVVVSLRGSYGGSSMLRALAALPGVVVLPGQGQQRFQPLLLEDLADLVLRCLPAPAARGQVLHAVGPQSLSLRAYLLSTRAWLKLPTPWIIQVPLPLVRGLAWLGERLGEGPLGATITGMLERGNVAPAGALEQLEALLDWRPRGLPIVLGQSPSFVQDRWHARLYLLAPLIWLVLVLLWLGSGVAGLLAMAPAWQPVLTPLGVPETLQYPLVLATSLMDIGLGIALLLRRRVRLVLGLMLLAVSGYTLIIGVLAPGLWLAPLGELLKNLPILALLLVALVLEDAR